MKKIRIMNKKTQALLPQYGRPLPTSPKKRSALHPRTAERLRRSPQGELCRRFSMKNGADDVMSSAPRHINDSMFFGGHSVVLKALP